MGTLSLTEMLLKELEAEVQKPRRSIKANYDDNAALEEYLQSRDACTPPPQCDWRAMIMKPDDNLDLEPTKTHSFMEILEGEVNNELTQRSLRGIACKPDLNCRLKTPAMTSMDMLHRAPPPISLPPGHVHPPSMVTVPPPAMMMSAPPPHPMTAPPPLRVPTPMSAPPPMMGVPMPMMGVPPPPINYSYSAMMNPSMVPYPGIMNKNYHSNSGYCNKLGMISYPNIPISVATIPDTTLATQMKNIKKKRQRKDESLDKLPESEVRPPSPAAPPTEPPIVPPPPPEAAPTPSPANSLALKHVREHKLVVKVDKRTLKEPLAVQCADDKSKRVVHNSDSDETTEKNTNNKSNKKSLQDPITSLRLGENEALPDLYSKLRKLNEELAMLQEQEEGTRSSFSSSSDEDERIISKASRFANRMATAQSSVQNTTANIPLADEVLMPAGNIISPARPNLDIRIKMMMDDKNAPVRKPVQPASNSIVVATPIQTAGKLVPLPPLPQSAPPLPVKKTSTPVTVLPDDLAKPLQRPPSPYLSKDIYHYWHKESLKFRKIRKKSALPYVDPNIRHKFYKSRAVSSATKPLGKAKMPKSKMALNIYSLLDKNLQESTESNIETDETKTVLSDEIEEDLKRLEEINRELKMLEEAERMEVESKVIEEDDDDEKNLRRLEEITRELKKLEEEEADDGDDDDDDNDDEEGKHFRVETSVDCHIENDMQATSLSPHEEEHLHSAAAKTNGRATSDTHREPLLHNGKRAADETLMSLVMNSVMEELKKDLRKSLASTMINDKLVEFDAIQCKKQKTEV